MRRILLGLKIALFILLFAPSLTGCIYVEFPSNPLGIDLDGGIGGLNGLLGGQLDATATDTSDASMNDLNDDQEDPGMDRTGPTADMDAGVVTITHPDMDAGVTTPTDGGATRTPMDASMTTGPMIRPNTIQAVALAATACNSRRMTNPADWLTGARNAHMKVWHICYRTASPMMATATMPHARPDSVSIHWYNRTAGMTELARVAAPRVADPWTANFLIALPEGTPPVFNVSNNYPASQVFAVQSPDSVPPFNINGTLQLWEVDQTGLQTERSPRPFCRDPHRVSGPNNFFWADVTHCDGLDTSCNDMFLFYQCRTP